MHPQMRQSPTTIVQCMHSNNAAYCHACVLQPPNIQRAVMADDFIAYTTMRCHNSYAHRATKQNTTILDDRVTYDGRRVTMLKSFDA
eukprot:6841756-Lingulodinium_polyedra.AAC.1